MRLTHRPILLCCISTLCQPPSWPLPAALMPWSLHPFVHGSCKFFFFNCFAFAHSGFIVPSCCICSLVPCPLSHAASVLMPHPFSHAASSPPPMLHQPPFPWPIPAALTSRPMRAVSDASVLIDAPPLHAVLCVRYAPTPSYTLASPYACVCECSCAIVHLLLYMY